MDRGESKSAVFSRHSLLATRHSEPQFRRRHARGFKRQVQDEGRALAGLALDLGPAAVQLDQGHGHCRRSEYQVEVGNVTL